MISSEEIGNLISDHLQISTEQTLEIEKLLDKYPWSGSLFMLYCLGQKQSKAINFDELLARSAVHTSDRERLHDLLAKSKKPTKERHDHLADKNESTKPDTGVLVHESAEAAKSDIKGSKTDSLPGKIASVKEPEVQVKHEDQHPTNTDDTELEKLYLSHAIGVGFDFGEDEAAHEEQTKPVLDDIFIELPEPKAKSDEATATTKSDEVIFDFPEPDRSKMSFSEWLNYKKTKCAVKGKIEARFDEQEVENFRQTQFFDPVKAAKESLIDRDDIVTETLAKVHLQQHNFGHAIEVYRQLMVLNPEKKAYFAGRISEIEAGFKQ